jgi:hypothetical protein
LTTTSSAPKPLHIFPNPGDKFRKFQPAPRFAALASKVSDLVPQHADFREKGILPLEGVLDSGARAENRLTGFSPSRRRCLGHPARCHRLRQSCCRPGRGRQAVRRSRLLWRSGRCPLLSKREFSVRQICIHSCPISVLRNEAKRFCSWLNSLVADCSLLLNCRREDHDPNNPISGENRCRRSVGSKRINNLILMNVRIRNSMYLLCKTPSWTITVARDQVCALCILKGPIEAPVGCLCSGHCTEIAWQGSVGSAQEFCCPAGTVGAEMQRTI